MDISINIGQLKVISARLSVLLPEPGRSAFANRTIARMPTEKVTQLRTLRDNFEAIINFKTARKDTPAVASATITIEEFNLMKSVMEDTDGKF